MISLYDWCQENNRQDLLDEWNTKKNGELCPSDVTAHSGQKYWWKCSKDHEWQASIDSRTGVNKTGCPYCSGRYAISGKNDLQSVCPELSREWHPYKNGSLSPENVLSHSSQKVWWLGTCGHEWQAKVSDRSRGKGCPFCSNKKVLLGYNDLMSKYPTIAKEWHPDKNGSLTPAEILYGSHKKVWWKCQNGHEWEAEVKCRTGSNKTGSPYCSGRYVVLGENDLQSKNPNIASEWSFEKNGELKPEDVTSGSSKIVWWKCSKGHEWQAAVNSRTGKSKTGCPYCSNKKVIPGYNDLISVNPQLASEWDYEKNKDLVNKYGIDISTPDRLTAVSGNKVWWKCKYGHEWQATVANRSYGTGCPLCSKAGTSVPEQGVAFYIEQICKVEQRIKFKGKEIDVYLPEYKIGIEYDGVFYHKSDKIQKEIEKDKKFADIGIKIIRIKESDSNHSERNLIYYKTDDMRSNYEWALKELCQLLVKMTKNNRFNAIDIDVQRDLLKIRERIDLYVKKNSLATLFPDVAKEWNEEKNGQLRPDMFLSGSDIKIWWKCAKGHEWQASISHRTSRKDGCPYCSQKRTLKGYNDFESWCIANDRKYILDEWDYNKNERMPSSYSHQSTQRVWWRCSKGHEWQTSIGHRADGHGCPYCKGVKKCIKNIDTGEVFESLTDAANAYGIKHKTSISMCCLGNYKTAGGYHWKYCDDSPI